ncbi:ubiquitin-ubiquitin ligase HUL5 [Paracoccidioides brasiliensis Pb18]|uniref:HECT-type E3 ubiquitin transferase n=1 Tax=Paracoccidioides brasiliensis (strain Pb18) TaxID=502780 RepID=C1GL96_PARBD|nr:ubiquitin-ubiquitin ligase HUL5 [Paracoccidioides brasiliensis Pb18]EEH43062.1 hypothetical protein PADG_07882 [Paracoccidioides brasiliensis Pb18]
MFQSFTGSSRRPRQVNLSNRSTNTFAAHPSGRPTPAGPGPQSTLALAQQERLQRQLDRERLNASRTLQRTWRGHKSRMVTKETWRQEWDDVERRRGLDVFSAGSDVGSLDSWVATPRPYTNPTDCLSQLRKLLRFVWVKDRDDWARLSYFGKCFQMTLEEAPVLQPDGEWTLTLERFGGVVLKFLAVAPTSVAPVSVVNDLLRLVIFLSVLIPKQITRLAEQYYAVLASITLNLRTPALDFSQLRDMVVKSVLALLQPITSETLDAYEWFGRNYLTVPSLDHHLGKIDDLATGVNYKLLASAIDSHILPSTDSFLQLKDVDKRLWLLSYFIFFHQHAMGGGVVKQSPETLFVKVVTGLLSPIAGDVSRGLGIEELTQSGLTPLPPFIRSQLLTLVDQHSITHLLTQAESSKSPTSGASQQSQHQASEDAKALAAYALTLLRVFAKRGDEIRMWLYLGSAMGTGKDGDSATGRLPAIKYFWHASRSTNVFRNIVQNSRDVLAMLQPASARSSQEGNRVVQQSNDRDREWTIILLFLELYTFLLKVLDDDEFFSVTPSLGRTTKNPNDSWTQESALPLADVKELTIFLKNLAFTLYWNAADLTASEAETNDPGGIRNYFVTGGTSPEPASSTLKSNASSILVGATGIPLDYFKGLVTGLLRMVHERDSRRKFLPDGLFLMVDRFDMEGFIPTVVAEEENRHQLQEEDEDDEQSDEAQDETTDDGLDQSRTLIGTGRAQQLRRIEEFRKRYQQVARRKELEAVAPRLEILRNIPFFIPFATRVQIFREFIYRDQVQRRRGYIDPDSWRFSVAHHSLGEDGRLGNDVLSKHHATINRESLFQDAFEQFYDLGDGLKEPIQISFIDKFGTQEAGIDGGGVTKEFLTSVIGDAFNPSGDSSLFIENDQHLLYPNPTIVEQRKAQLRHQGVKERSVEWNREIKDILKRYEFLGRIIGKCLYEGILVDVSFAGFFLLKWALTGGTSSARKESSYRANLNDVRDLDESLYQGLLQLKNYPGDVEDFSLNFTVTDTVTVPLTTPTGKPYTTTQSTTKELKPHGSDIPVTNQNRLVYISYIARHRLQAQPYLQTNAFLQGLGTIIQPSWLSMFNQSELQTLVGGEAGEIDVSDLRRNTVYSGVYIVGDDGQEHPTIKLFWEVMEAMTNEERRKVLKFVTSTPRAPLLGFSHLNPRFSIRDSSVDEERLPSTSTCANLLKLPRYTRRETLREKLMYAINSGAGFDLS